MSNTEIVQKAFAAVEAGSAGDLAGLIADDFSFSGPVPRPLNKSEFLAFISLLKAAIPDWRFNAAGFQEKGDSVFARFHVTGTNTGTLTLPYFGLNSVMATGQCFALPEEPVEVVVRNGKLAGFKVLPVPGGGVEGILHQIGVRIHGPAKGGAAAPFRAPTPASKKELLELILSQLEHGDTREAAKHIADDFTFAGPVRQGPVPKGDFLMSMQDLVRAFPDWRFNPSDFQEQGDVLRYTQRAAGTHTGTLDMPSAGIRDFPATGRRVSLPAERVEAVFKGGQLYELWISPVPGGWMFGVLEQLGLLAPAGA